MVFSYSGDGFAASLGNGKLTGIARAVEKVTGEAEYIILNLIESMSSTGRLVEAPDAAPVSCSVPPIRSESVCLRCSRSSSVILLSVSIALIQEYMTSPGQVDVNS